MNKQLDAALEEAGLPRLRVHDLRHTVGHSTITLTLDTYCHVTPGLHAAAAAEVEALLGHP